MDKMIWVDVSAAPDRVLMTPRTPQTCRVDPEHECLVGVEGGREQERADLTAQPPSAHMMQHSVNTPSHGDPVKR